MAERSFFIYLLLIISLFLGLILCFFGYRVDRILTNLLKREDRFYDTIVHQMFPGPKGGNVNLLLLPKFIYIFFWIIISAVIQGLGHILKLLVFMLFILAADSIISIYFNLPSIFTIQHKYALGIIIGLSLLFVTIEIYYPSLTKLFLMIITSITGALIAISVLIYTQDNSFNPFSKDIINKDFIKNHFTYTVIIVWLALGLFGLFVQYKENITSNSELIKWEDNWPDY